MNKKLIFPFTTIYIRKYKIYMKGLKIVPTYKTADRERI